MSNIDFQTILSEVSAHLKYLSIDGVNYLDIQSKVSLNAPELSLEIPTKNDAGISTPGSLAELRTHIGDCRRCRLCKSRTNLVFGEGNPCADLVLVGEGPGFDEDQTGRPFVGKAGQLLDKIISAMGLSREEVYICNIVKCRPPQNRDPEPIETETCGSFLNMQLDIIKPRIILALGRISGRYLINRPGASIRSMRGAFHQYRGIDVRVTYHPAALLRDRSYRRPMWEDVQIIMEKLGRPITN